LANIQSAKKRARQSTSRRLANASKRSYLRSQLKKVVLAIGNGNKPDAETAYKNAVPIIDKMTNKGLIHRNKAARHKSKLNQQIRALV
jgi:small subunit ribosomal protein S20